LSLLVKANKPVDRQDGLVPHHDSAAAAPIFPDLLVERICDRIPLGRRAIGVVDGADAAKPVEFAHRIRERIRSSYRTAWFDFDAVDREVVAPLRAGGRGRFLPRLWDEATDRSARARLVDAAPDQVLVIAGPTILGRIDDAAVTVHLKLSEGALRRRTPVEASWTIPPILTYYADTGFEPDFTVRWDHPDKPAVLPRG
jgi:hypothetical protein